ncbi:uncharacterized protein TrAtP1_010918 [Trichoderma atroviride]|uniref:uncharacterized protein n=1 Tax=Hypocrea atroviridis TaxID=63577 RepID=UPI0033195799|nr:hypothetical protein TrAtP1_010918 [Trichoderma atroviride]
MVNAGFTASRRALRSSIMFRSIVGGCLLFCALIAWSGTLFYLQGDSLTAWLDSAGTRNSGIMSMAYDEQQPELDYEPTRVDITTLTPRMPLRIVTFNVRYATSSPVRGEKPWSVRGSKLINELNFITAGHENAFLTFQEVLYDQLQDIRHGLGPSWASIGRGRDDGEKKGEFSPVFYRSDVWRLERSQTRWLSETPEKPSYGWGASHRRVVVMGEFSHKVTGTKVVVMSTHFDYQHKKARLHSAEHLLQYARDWSTANDTSAVLIGGDFNSTPDDVAYKLMTAPGSGMYDVSDLPPGGEAPRQPPDVHQLRRAQRVATTNRLSLHPGARHCYCQDV